MGTSSSGNISTVLLQSISSGGRAPIGHSSTCTTDPVLPLEGFQKVIQFYFSLQKEPILLTTDAPLHRKDSSNYAKTTVTLIKVSDSTHTT